MGSHIRIVPQPPKGHFQIFPYKGNPLKSVRESIPEFANLKENVGKVMECPKTIKNSPDDYHSPLSWGYSRAHGRKAYIGVRIFLDALLHLLQYLRELVDVSPWYQDANRDRDYALILILSCLHDLFPLSDSSLVDLVLHLRSHPESYDSECESLKALRHRSSGHDEIQVNPHESTCQ